MFVLLLLLNCIIIIRSQMCNDKIFHINTDTKSILCLDDNGNMEITGNITTTGYCNCKMENNNIPSFNYSFGTYIPKIGDGLYWYNTTYSKGVYNIINNYLTLNIFLIWFNLTSDMSLQNNNLLITLPIQTNNIIPNYSGYISYLKGMSYSYEIGVETYNNTLIFYTLLSNGNNKPIKIKDSMLSGEVHLSISYYI